MRFTPSRRELSWVLQVEKVTGYSHLVFEFLLF